jgi:glycogen synthase
MRILHVSSLYPPGVVGGAEKVAAMLAEAEARRGHEVRVVYLSRGGGPPRLQNDVQVAPLKSRNLLWIEDVQQSPRVLRTANKLLQAVNLWSAADISREIADFAPDLVHTHSMVEFPPLVWSAAKHGGAALVHTLHDYDLLCSRATLFRDGRSCSRLHAACAGLKLWKGLFADRIDAVAAVSRPVLDLHLRHGVFAHLPDARRAVIWNAAEPRKAEPYRAGPRAGRTGPFTFGFLGRLVPEKGLGVLLEACRRLPREGWRLRVAGRAPDGAERFEARAEGLPVEFLGFTDPARFLDTVDVLVVPSIWAEPFGLTVIEAFAAGAPVIGSDCGAVAELAASLGSEWVVPAGDAEALAVRMANVLDQGREALPTADAFGAVLAAASPERMTTAYLDLYLEALRVSPRRPAAAARGQAAPAALYAARSDSTNAL